MDDRDWNDDGDYDRAVRRARRVTRFGWGAIGVTVGALGCALIGVVGMAVWCVYVLVAAHS
ncbi:hypothetical protein [Streptomyces sp. NPDC005435]|uniref:hypothetical protein n=1 Tax=Streptomyces sp. NPDC005435 TaxID=3154464 RepID=UPI003456A262